MNRISFTDGVFDLVEHSSVLDVEWHLNGESVAINAGCTMVRSFNVGRKGDA